MTDILYTATKVLNHRKEYPNIPEEDFFLLNDLLAYHSDMVNDGLKYTFPVVNQIKALLVTNKVLIEDEYDDDEGGIYEEV